MLGQHVALKSSGGLGTLPHVAAIHRKGGWVPYSLTARNSRRLVTVSGLGSSFKNFLTGSAASVQLVTDNEAEGIGPPMISAPFDVLIRVTASSDIDINKVYLKIRNYEMLDQYPVDTLSVDETVTDTAFIFDTEMDVAGERTIPEGKSMEWKAQVTLPENLRPSFSGKYIRNVWEMEAGLGTGITGGKNPTTGWIELKVRE
eukprot:jgi/Tetstr1/442456/TSEL_003202.t1